jgi:hypothetical protein
MCAAMDSWPILKHLKCINCMRADVGAASRRLDKLPSFLDAWFTSRAERCIHHSSGMIANDLIGDQRHRQYVRQAVRQAGCEAPDLLHGSFCACNYSVLPQDEAVTLTYYCQGEAHNTTCTCASS